MLELMKNKKCDRLTVRHCVVPRHSFTAYVDIQQAMQEKWKKKEKNILQQNCKEQASYTRKKQTAQEDNFLPGLHVAEISLI